MAVNKVVVGNETKIDLSGDTVTEGDVMSGKTFHRADGGISTGTYDPSGVWVAILNISTQMQELYGQTITITKVEDE